jgi:hypothetical protein
MNVRIHMRELNHSTGNTDSLFLIRAEKGKSAYAMALMKREGKPRRRGTEPPLEAANFDRSSSSANVDS